MKVLLCDKCEKVLRVGSTVIYGGLALHEILEELALASISLNILNGEHFCSTKCVKDGLNESN